MCVSMALYLPSTRDYVAFVCFALALTSWHQFCFTLICYVTGAWFPRCSSVNMEQDIICFVPTSLTSRMSLLPDPASHIGVSVRPTSTQWLDRYFLFGNRINSLRLIRIDHCNARLKWHGELYRKC